MKKAAILCYDWPSSNGGYNKSISSCISQYEEFFDLTILVFSDHYETTESDKYKIVHIPVKKRNQFRDFIASIFKLGPAVEHRYKESYSSIRQIVICDEFDFLICQGILLGPAVKYFSNLKKSILMSHDCYQKAFNNIWKTKKFPLSAAWYIEERKLKYFERNVVSFYDAMFAITNEDKCAYADSGIPCNGTFHRFPPIALPKSCKTNKKDVSAANLLTVGRIDDRKEVGTVRFIDGAFRRLKVDFPALRYTLIGKYTGRFDSPDNGIFGLGFLSSCEEYYSRETIFLNLQEQGAGIQFKTLDALSRRMVVICSVQSSLGLPPKLRRFVHTYHDDDTLYTAIKRLLSDEQYFTNAVNQLEELMASDFFDSGMIDGNRNILERIARLDI